jgi:hypothetical protein
MSERPRLRPDLVLVEQTYRGEQSYILKDPTTHKYFRFRPVEIAVMQSLDGQRTVTEAAVALTEQGIRVTGAAVAKFAEKLKSPRALDTSPGAAPRGAAPSTPTSAVQGRAATHALVGR